MLIELCIHKGILHESLTIVEHTIDLDSRDVLAKGRKLALLNRRYLALGIEHIDMDAVDTQEAVGHSRACVARGGYEHVHLLTFSLLTDEILKQARHEAGTYILKGESGAMEEFEGVDIILDIHDRTVERQCVVDNILQGIRIHILTKEGIGNRVGNLLERHLVDIVEESLG